MSEKRPAFLFYASDWLTSTAFMDAEQRGMYINLLAYQWVNGELPDDLQVLCRLAGIDSTSSSATSKLQALLKQKFKHTTSTTYVNLRLEQVREKFAASAEILSERGRKGAEAKKAKAAQKQRLLDGVAASSSATSSASSTTTSILAENEYKDVNEDELKNRKGVENENFNGARGAVKFQTVYSLKAGRPRPLEIAYAQCLIRMGGEYEKSSELLEKRAAEFMAYCIKAKTGTQYIPNPETWLEDDSWKIDWHQRAISFIPIVDKGIIPKTPDEKLQREIQAAKDSMRLNQPFD